MAADVLPEIYEINDELLDVIPADYWQTHRRVPAADTGVTAIWDDKSRRSVVLVASCRTVIGYLPPPHDALVSAQCCGGTVTWSRGGTDPVVRVRLRPTA
jgi:hypothetical protein